MALTSKNKTIVMQTNKLKLGKKCSALILESRKAKRFQNSLASKTELAVLKKNTPL